MLRIDFEGSDERLLAFVRSRRVQLQELLRLRMTATMTLLQSHIVGDKLSGQVLHHRTGKLIDSIRLNPPEATANENEVVGGVAGGGGPAFYGRIHEYGGTFDVKERERRFGFNRSGEIVKLLTKSGAVRKGIYGVGQQKVKAHTVTFPERSFMRTSFSELRERIIAELQDAVNKALSA